MRLVSGNPLKKSLHRLQWQIYLPFHILQLLKSLPFYSSSLELEKLITQVTLASAEIAFVRIHGGRVVLADPLVAKLLHNAFFDKEYTCPVWDEQSF